MSGGGPALRVIEGGGDTGGAPARGRAALWGGGAALTAAAIGLEYARATRGGALSDLALALVIGCSIMVIVGAMRRYPSALRAWLAAAAVHVVAALASFAYFHAVLFDAHPVPLTRGEFMLLQLKALVGFVAVVGLVCMVASAVRKAVR